MKKFVMALVALVVAGCTYQETNVTLEGDRPVAIHLRGFASEMKTPLVRVDGCDYFVLHMGNTNNSFRIVHQGNCKICKTRSWSDDEKRTKTSQVQVREVGVIYLEYFKLDGCDYFAAKTWGGGSWDIVHMGNCIQCRKRR